MTIFLIGYMASGKTTLGHALAKALGYQFIDLDFYISQRYRKTVSQIFAEKGEEEFRRMESRMLREVGEFYDVVVSCGGGTPCFNDNIGYMNQTGITILLEASTESTVRRLLAAKTRRPIIETVSREKLPEFVESHKKERHAHYSKARFRLDTSDLESGKAIHIAVEKARHILDI